MFQTNGEWGESGQPRRDQQVFSIQIAENACRVDDQSPDTLISGHLAFQNEKAPDLHFWTIAGAVQFGLAHKI